MAHFAITTDARAEAIESFGEDFSISVLGVYCSRRGIYAPVCANRDGTTFLDASRARHVWEDMLEAV